MGTLASRRFVALTSLLAALFAASGAHAQSPRRAVVTTLLHGDLPAVLVASDRAWAPTLASQVKLQLCAGSRCASIVRVETCSVPRCPGDGALVVAAHSVADVGDYPTDREGFERERAAILSDPVLAPLYGMTRVHPDPPPPPPHATNLEWLGEDDGWAFDGTLDTSVGVTAPDGRAALGGEARLAFRYTWRPDGSDDDLVAILLGNSVGPELVVRALELPDGNGAGAMSVGLGAASSYIERHWSVRAPSVYLSFVPDLGLIVRDGYKPAFYLGWSVPVAMLVDPHVALEARLSVLMVDAWVPGDDVGFLATASVGVVLR